MKPPMKPPAGRGDGPEDEEPRPVPAPIGAARPSVPLSAVPPAPIPRKDSIPGPLPAPGGAPLRRSSG